MLPLTNTKDAALHHFKGVLYGPPGVGKTAAARTMLPLGRTLILSGESGLAPLAGYDIDVFEVKSYQHLGEALRALVSGQVPHDCIYVDSLTEMGKLIEQAVFARFAVDDGSGNLAVPKNKNFDYYGTLSREQEQFVRIIRDLKKHVFFSALPKHWKNDQTGEEGYRPMFGSGALAEVLPGLFDFVFTYRPIVNPETSEITRALFTQPYEGWSAKARQRVDKPVLPAVIQNPDLSVIVKSVLGS